MLHAKDSRCLEGLQLICVGWKLVNKHKGSMQVLYRNNLVLQHDAETTEWKVALIVFPFIWPRNVYSLQPAECLFKVFGYSSWISYHAVWCQLNLCVLSWDFSKTVYLCLCWNHLAIHKRNLILGSMYFCCYDWKWYLFKVLVEKHMCCFTLVLCIFLFQTEPSGITRNIRTRNFKIQRV